jgi:phenylacetate-CoA ligase
LAWEKHEKFLYYPFQTYGYCEAVADETNGGYKLVGTSYTNDASPMVRYDTDDDIEPVEVDGHILQSFRVRAGRVGEVVLDRKGQRIPLTGLIFGRHHRLFDIAKFVQVRQATAGQMTVVAVMKGEIPAGFRFEEWFDATGIDMAVSFEVAERPLLAPSGKVMLLLR